MNYTVFSVSRNVPELEHQSVEKKNRSQKNSNGTLAAGTPVSWKKKPLELTPFENVPIILWKSFLVEVAKIGNN